MAAAQFHPLQECSAGGWGVGGEGRCLAAEVRPYSELAGHLSSLLVRGGGGGGEEGDGEGEKEKQLQRAVGGLPIGEGPIPVLGSWETPPSLPLNLSE